MAVGVGWGEVINGGLWHVVGWFGSMSETDRIHAALGCEQRHCKAQLGWEIQARSFRHVKR